MIMMIDALVVNDGRGTMKLFWSWYLNASFLRCSATTHSSSPTASAPAITLSVLSEVKKIIKADIALHGNPISELPDVTCHMGSHSVTWHPT